MSAHFLSSAPPPPLISSAQPVKTDLEVSLRPPTHRLFLKTEACSHCLHCLKSSLVLSPMTKQLLPNSSAQTTAQWNTQNISHANSVGMFGSMYYWTSLFTRLLLTIIPLTMGLLGLLPLIKGSSSLSVRTSSDFNVGDLVIRPQSTTLPFSSCTGNYFLSDQPASHLHFVSNTAGSPCGIHRPPFRTASTASFSQTSSDPRSSQSPQYAPRVFA